VKKITTCLMAVAFVFSFASVSFAGDAAAGKKLFMKKCKTCHKWKSDKAKTGPGLKSVVSRRGEDYLKRWLSDPKAMFASKNPCDIKNVENALSRLKKPKKIAGYKAKMPKQVKNLNKKGPAWIDDMIAYLKTL